jgi:hypothetical protein
MVALGALAILAALLALAILTLTTLALDVPAVALLARREICRRRLLVRSDEHLGAIGQVGKARRHHAITWRQSA